MSIYQDLGVIPNVTEGTALPTPLITDKENDTYIRLNATGTIIGTYTYNGTAWILTTGADDLVDVTGVIFPLIFPLVTLPGVPVFSPSTPATIGLTYAITDTTQTQLVYGKWTGTQYISAPAPASLNIRYGLISPSFVVGDKKGDLYYRTKSGTSSLQPYEEYVFTGTVWYRLDGEDNYLVHPLDKAPGGVCPIEATSYLDFNGGWSATMTLPTASSRKNEIFTFKHDAGFDTTVLATNKYPATPLLVNSTIPSVRFISDGVNWCELPQTNTIVRAQVRANTMTGTASGINGTAITFANEELDTTNSFNPATGTFTAPRTGQYAITCQFFVGSVNAAVGSRFGVILSTNGGGFGAGSPIITYYSPVTNPASSVFGGSYVKTLSAGSTLTFRAFLDTATSWSLSGNANFDYITITEINNTF